MQEREKNLFWGGSSLKFVVLFLQRMNLKILVWHTFVCGSFSGGT